MKHIYQYCTVSSVVLVVVDDDDVVIIILVLAVRAILHNCLLFLCCQMFFLYRIIIQAWTFRQIQSATWTDLKLVATFPFERC